MLVSAVSMHGVIPAVKNSPKSNSNYAFTAQSHDTFQKSEVSFSSGAEAMRRKLQQAGVRVPRNSSKADLRRLRDSAGVGGGVVRPKHVEPGEESCPTGEEILACHRRNQARGLYRPDGTFDMRKAWGLKTK